MSEPTPPPWEVEGSIYRGFKAAVSGGEPRRTIAQVRTLVDADLIAAAPVLLAEAKALVRAVSRLEGIPVPYPIAIPIGIALKATEAAIAAAEGTASQESIKTNSVGRAEAKE